MYQVLKQKLNIPRTKRIKSILNYYMIRHVFNNSEVDNLLHRSHHLIGSKTDEEK